MTRVAELQEALAADLRTHVTIAGSRGKHSLRVSASLWGSGRPGGRKVATLHGSASWLPCSVSSMGLRATTPGA